MRELHADTRRLDEVLEPVEFAITQDAESFPQVQDTPLRIAVSDRRIATAVRQRNRS